jgi:linoleoyl-CoA desaturase
MTLIPKFSSVSQSFHTELKKRIAEYFKQSGKAPTGNWGLFIKALVLVISLIALYIHLVFYTPVTWVAIVECVVFGFVTASVGFNVMHDGGHGSFSRIRWVNKMAAMSVNFLGANNFMWNTKHNIIHHSYTNIDGIDDDIDAKPILRLCETQKFYKVHRYQHLYFWFAYSLLYIYWVFVSDYKKYFSGKIGPMPIKKMKLGDHFSFWGFKLIHAFLFIFIPIYFAGFTPWLIGFFTSGLVAGLVISIVFQLAHTVEHTQFPVADEKSGRIEDQWAIHQLKTTANFATRNKLISWWVGGLNFQIEHHLFPKISHVHYPAISKIIRKACQDYGIPYIEYPKMTLAVASHVSFLRQMGKMNSK